MKVSIVIPTLDEAGNLEKAVTALAPADPEIEVLVSDGGSKDATVELAKALGLRVVQGPKGRGQQLRRGAETATGEVLVFLHADTLLGPGAIAALRAALDEPSLVGGNFQLRFSGDSAFATWLMDFYSRIRARGFYYGDSAVFVRRSVYESLGGIRPIALMEDFDFIRRMERAGRTVCIADPPALTSSRRFEGRKPWRIVSQWIVIHLLFFVGCPPGLLARIYRSDTHRPGREKRSRSVTKEC